MGGNPNRPSQLSRRERGPPTVEELQIAIVVTREAIEIEVIEGTGRCMSVGVLDSQDIPHQGSLKPGRLGACRSTFTI